MDADAGAQLVDIDRLGQVIDAAGFESPHHMLRLGEAGHEDHGHLGDRSIRLQPRAGVEAVHTGHDRIEQDDVRRDAIGDVERRVAGGRDQYGKAGLFQRFGQEAERLRRIVDEEYDVAGVRCLRHGHSPPRRAGV